MFNATQNFVAISLRILHISDSWSSISFLHITVQNVGGRGYLTDSAQFTANVTILSSDTRHRDLETQGDGTAAQPLAPLRTNSQMRYFRVLSRNLVVTQWRRYLAPLPVISLEVGVNVNNCNKLHSVHADAACEMNINKNVNCCCLLL